ncbi:hypothetical protein HN358_02895 [Candidatus Uhrbacteria bacterium]|jgi:hypothetical protein|nr:hypothetical protein [Candidatus Uhrbacteria bacterium]MBT7717148.1 hypothetical protein [Candidatus Uhrbacteria bacterium]
MTKALSLFALSFLVAIPLLGTMTFATNVPVAHAQQLDTSDFFDDDFSDSSGLGQANLKETIGNLIRVFLGFLGIIAVVMVLLGGFKWMTASGNEDKVSEAKRLLIAGVIGLAIILSAFAITSFVIDSVITASAG